MLFRSRGQSSYLVSNADGLRLELGNGGRIDLEIFNEELSRAGEARDAGDFDLYFKALHEAADLYRGELLSEDIYEDWCPKQREMLLNRYVGLAANLAMEHLRRGDGIEALSHLEEAIIKDPNREELYRKKMIICSQTGNRAGIEEAYHGCSKHLRDTYDVSPSLETTELYQRLRK